MVARTNELKKQSFREPGNEKEAEFERNEGE